MLVSIIIPCYQNEAQLSGTIDRIQLAVKGLDEEFEIILIDDGSTDGTWKIIQSLFDQYHNMIGIKLKANIGAYNAILAGFDSSKGDALLVMAADGDDPPELIPQLVKDLNGRDAVLANRSSSKKSFGSVLNSKLFYGILRILGGKNIPVGGSDFLIVKRATYQRCLQVGFKSGNTLIQLAQHANEIATIPYTKGRSKPTTWSFIRKASLFIQTVNQFITIPFVQSYATEYEIATRLDR